VKPRRFPVLLSLLLASCGADEALNPESDVPAAELGTILETPLDELTRTEAEVLCREDARQTDWCGEIGFQQDTTERCREVVASCSAFGGEPPSVDCTGSDFGPPGTCPVPAGAYLDCARAWIAARSCDNVGLFLDAPPKCQDLMARCPRFSGVFVQQGAPPPCARVPGDTVEPIDDADDVYGADGCRPLPERLVVLGDSIAACSFLGEREACAPALLGEYLKTRYAPGLSVETKADGGTLTSDLPRQAREVAGGPGHVLVWVFSIGNDLLIQNLDFPAWEAAWTEVFAYFGDPARFPGGATFLLNTQYSPYDQCPDPPGPSTGISDAEEQQLQQINRRLFIDVAIRRADTVAVDHYPDWLGHGRNANILGCPHCQADNTAWLIDGVHPNLLGNSRIAAKAQVAADAMYGLACQQR
jgi:hypothetical protein